MKTRWPILAIKFVFEIIEVVIRRFAHPVVTVGNNKTESFGDLIRKFSTVLLRFAAGGSRHPLSMAMNMMSADDDDCGDADADDTDG